MIESDVIKHLKNDATLDALLGATASNSKIYPEIGTKIQQKTVPFIVYSVSELGRGWIDLVDADQIQFKVIHTNYTIAGNIRARLKFLLEIQDELRVGVNPPTSIASDKFYIYDGIQSGGPEFKDTPVKRFIRIRIFDFLYRRKAP